MPRSLFFAFDKEKAAGLIVYKILACYSEKNLSLIHISEPTRH